MNPYRIIAYCKHIEENCLYDFDATSHYYEVSYEENHVIIDLYNVYIINNKYKHKLQEQKVIDNITSKEFCNFIIQIYEHKLHIKELSYTDFEIIAPKIKINTIK